nr:hypothetical protein [uncultured Nocardioides sp.]
MTANARRLLLALSSFIGIFAGMWAAVAPRSFYDSFPGLGFVWVGVDGPFNEHLIRDVGALYLALAGAGIAAMLVKDESASVACGRVVAVAWIVFSIPHLVYHATNLSGFSTADAVLMVLSLSSSIVIAIPLLLSPPGRMRATEREGAQLDHSGL